MRFTYKLNENGSQKGPEVAILYENVDPTWHFLKCLQMELRFQRELQLLDQLGARFVYVCSVFW